MGFGTVTQALIPGVSRAAAPAGVCVLYTQYFFV